MAACPSLATGSAFLSTLLRHIDCQGRTIGEAGYQALADGGSPVSIAITGLLTIFVGLFGLRMLLAEAPSPRDVVMSVVKIGIVLTLASSWPAYRTVIYDVVVEAPAQLSALIGRPAGLPGTSGDLITRLQAADNSIVLLTNLGTGREEAAALPATRVEGPPQRFPIADNPAFGWARVLFLSATTAAFAVVRLTAGILLALTPLFAGLLLFDLGRGLVLGWGRTLVFTLLASVGVTLVLAVELALLEPWLANAIDLRQNRQLAASAPVELLVLALAFAVALLILLGILLRTAFMVSLPSLPWRSVLTWRPGAQDQQTRAPFAPAPAAAPTDQREIVRPGARALAVADSVQAAQRRERTLQVQATAATPAAATAGAAASASSADDLGIPSYGQALRRAKPRKSLSAALRDRRS